MNEIRQRVLFFVPYGSHRAHNQLDAVIAAALAARGCDVVVVLCDGIFDDCHVTVWSADRKEHCRRCSLDATSLFSTFRLPSVQLRSGLTKEDVSAVSRWVDGLDAAEYATIRFEGLPVGEWTLPPLYSRFRIKSEYLASADMCAVFKRYLVHAALTVRAMRKIYDEFLPDAVCMWSGWAVPYRVAFELAKMRGARVVTHERGAQIQIPGGSFRVVSGDFPGTNATFNEVAAAWANIPLSRIEMEAVKEFFGNHERTGGGGMYGCSTEISEVRSRLNIPPEAKIISVFTSGDYETSTHPDFKVAPDQIEVLKHLLELLDSTEYYVVIRHHPNMASGEGKAGESRFISRAYDLTRKLGARVRTIMPHEDMTSYALLWTTEIAVSFYSSVAIEAAFRGVPSTVFEISPYAGAFQHTISATYQNGGLKSVLNSLFEKQREVSVDDLRRLYRHVRSIFFKTEKVLRSCGIKNQFEMDIRVQSTEDLLPGYDPELDRICDYLTQGTSIVTMPTDEERSRDGIEETVFLAQEARAVMARRDALDRTSRVALLPSRPRVAIVMCGSNARLERSLSRSRYDGWSVYHCSIDRHALIERLLGVLSSVSEEFVAVAVGSQEYDESFLSTAIRTLDEVSDAGVVSVGAWILEGDVIKAEWRTKYRPDESADAGAAALGALSPPELYYLSLGLYRREFLVRILHELAGIPGLNDRVERVLSLSHEGKVQRLHLPLVLIHRDLDCETFVDKEVSADPSGTRVVEIIGSAVKAMDAGDVETALRLFELSLDYKDKVPMVLYGKAVACVRLGRYQDARVALGEFLVREPGHLNGRELLALVEKGI